jgi:cation:H+ antiporter
VTEALLLVGGLLAIVAGSELFTNAVEWLGFRLHIASGATGSLLAAIGTALPETAVPVVALIGAHADADPIAIGSVLGSSFLLLTLGSGVTGLAVLSRRHARVLELDPAQARRDLGTFVGAFSLALLAILMAHWARLVIGVALLAIYGLYVVRTLKGGEPRESMPEPLHLLRWRDGPPHLAGVIVQLLISLVMLVVGSALFVDALSHAADALHVSPLVVALVAVPVATELPETLNSVLWVRSRDDGLAFGNIAGSATFQACILGWLGLTFTSWSPGPDGLLSAFLALGTALLLLALMRDGRTRGVWLLAAGLPWLAYVVVEIAAGGHLTT